MEYEWTEIDAQHPLFRLLRKGLWHCTSPSEYRQIYKDGFIKPNDGRLQKWGPEKYACQELGGISLFDFESHIEKDIWSQAAKWKQFLGCAKPVTIMIGLDKGKFTGKCVNYPEIEEGTTGNFIPFVEVCHCGPIPTIAISSCVLVFPYDYSRYYFESKLNDSRLSEIEAEFQAAAQEIESKQKAELSGVHLSKAEIQKATAPARERTLRLKRAKED